MREFIRIAALTGALLLSGAAYAADCEFPFDAIVGKFGEAGAVVKIIPPESLSSIGDEAEKVFGREIGAVTRGFVAVVGGKMLLGLETDGCLLPPIDLGPAPGGVEQLSGKDAAGRVGA